MIFGDIRPGRKTRVFRLSPSFVDQYRGKQPKWGPVGYFTYKRTYARDVPGENRTEEFWETCKRVVEGTFNIQKIHCRNLSTPWDEPKAQKSAQDMFERMWAFKFTPPGRGLWMMGTPLVYEKGSAALNNCFAGDTEVITRYGVRTLKELAADDGDPILLTTGGKWVEAPVRSFGKQKLFIC